MDLLTVIIPDDGVITASIISAQEIIVHIVCMNPELFNMLPSAFYNGSLINGVATGVPVMVRRVLRGGEVRLFALSPEPHRMIILNTPANIVFSL
jgi:hypothetical protein